jgi:hypothetical protein
MRRILPMSKEKSRSNLDEIYTTPKRFWNKVVSDTDAKIKATKKALSDLEAARETFRSNAQRNFPIPGSPGSARDVHAASSIAE